MADDEKTISQAEEKARNDGWVPKEEWVESGNDEESWVNYPEFNFRGELMNRISTQTRSIKSRDNELELLKKAIKELGDHNKKIAEMEYNKAIKELRQQKVRASKEENHEVVAELEEEIENLKEQKTSLKEETTTPPANTGTPQEFIDWVGDPKNSWYLNDTILNGAAIAIMGEFERTNQGATPAEALAHMEKRIKEEFPHKFNKGNGKTNLKKAKVTEPGETGTGTGTPGKKKFTKADLNEEQLSIGTTFVNSGAFENIQEYVDQLAEIGELGG